MRQTAELFDDGKEGEVSTEEWESKGKSTDHAVFKGCQVLRANADSNYPRGVYTLIIEDNRNDPHYKPKNSVPLGPGFTGWALPDKAEANLPADCAARMGSTAPNITVTLMAPSKKGEEEEKDLVDRDAPAIRNNAAVVQEAATKLAKKYGCAA